MSNEDLNDDDNENKDLPVRVHPGTPRRGLRESLQKLSGSSSPVMLEELKSILATHKNHSPENQSHRNDEEEDRPPARTRAQTADESKENYRDQGF